jgi:hypothetical protein
VLERAQELLVDAHRLVVAARRELRLLDEALALDDGSTSSEYPVASSKPRTYRSHFSTTPAIVRCSRTSGEVSSGKSMTKVGRSRPPLTKCSHSSSTYLPCVATFGHLDADLGGERPQFVERVAA